MRAPLPGRYADQFNLRLPDGMRERLKAEADANKRSMNTEIVARLEASLATAKVEPRKFLHDGQEFELDPDFFRDLARLMERMKARHIERYGGADRPPERYRATGVPARFAGKVAAEFSAEEARQQADVLRAEAARLDAIAAGKEPSD